MLGLVAGITECAVDCEDAEDEDADVDVKCCIEFNRYNISPLLNPNFANVVVGVVCMGALCGGGAIEICCSVGITEHVSAISNCTSFHVAVSLSGNTNLCIPTFVRRRNMNTMMKDSLGVITYYYLLLITSDMLFEYGF